MKQDNKARERSQKAVEILGSAIDIKINELTESNRQLKRKIFDLYTVFEISRNINSVLNYRTLVDSFLLTSLGQVGASAAALYLPPDIHCNFLKLAMSKGISEDKDVRGEINLDGRLATYIQAMAKPILLAELSEQMAASPALSFLKLFRHGLIIPLIMQAKLKGAMVLSGKVSGVGFGADDIEFLSILANQFVVALENARLYESEREALRELQIAQQQLVLSERRAAIGELSAKIAHEVNNPLSIISNYLHLCGRNLDHPEQAGEHLKVARQELARIARIVRQLLDFHRPQKAEKTPVDVISVIDDILALMELQLMDNHIVVERAYDESLPNIIGSAEQLKQVFLNLVINAKDFMPEGGTLKVSIAHEAENVKIIFADTGPGISDGNLSRVFEPFFTTKEGSSGTGLGLSVCFGIIKEHQGIITASNSPDGGAIFEITLPIANEVREES